MMTTKLKVQNQGFSLVDVMVGLVIAMLGMIIIFQVFAVSESVKRTTTSGSDAQQSGALALFTMQHDLKEAGYGIYNQNVSPLPNDIAASSPPVTITFGAANQSDSITVVSRKNWDYGQFYDQIFASTIASAVPPAPVAETFFVDNANVPASRNNAKGQLQLVSTTGSFTSTPYLTNGTVVSATNVVAEGVALMKAQYGTDANLNGVIDQGEWTTAAPFDPWKVMAIRLVVVTRSAQPEKPSVAGGPCDTTVAAPLWSGSISVAGSTATPLLLTGQADLLAAGDDWKCYRYKTFETVIPMRNIIWH